MIARPRSLARLVALAALLAAASGCGAGAGRAPMTVDAERYELPDGAAAEPPAGPGSDPTGGAIHNPKDDLFPPD